VGTKFSKQFFIIVLLLAVMGELLDPSTNFIRAGVAPKNQSFGKVHHDLSKVATTSNHSNSEDGSCDEYIVCYAILENFKPLDFIIFAQASEPTYYNIFIDRYIPDIFQPPKI